MRAGDSSHPSGAAVVANGISNSELHETWQRLAGFFEGNGNVGLEVTRHVLRFKLRFSYTCKPQVQTVHDLLTSVSVMNRLYLA